MTASGRRSCSSRPPLFAIVIGVLVGVFLPADRRARSATALRFLARRPIRCRSRTGCLLIIAFGRTLMVPGRRYARRPLRGNRFEEWLDIAHHLVLPALTLGLIYLAQYCCRGPRCEVLQSDYVRTARARLAERKVVYKHALRNAVIPVITIAELQFGALLSGALLVETVFNWPGLGRLAADSVFQRDAPVLLGVLIAGGARRRDQHPHRCGLPNDRPADSGRGAPDGRGPARTRFAGPSGLRMFLRNRAAVFGLVLLSGIVLMTLFGSFFYDRDPTRIIARPPGPRRGRPCVRHRLSRP